MKKELELISYWYFYIEKKIITKDEIISYIDNGIEKRKDTPSYFIELSLAKSLDELYLILNDYFPRENISFKRLDIHIILERLHNIYKLRGNDIFNTINIIFHLKDDINIHSNILDNIYLLDNNCDLYHEKVITLEELKKELETFFERNL